MAPAVVCTLPLPAFRPLQLSGGRLTGSPVGRRACRPALAVPLRACRHSLRLPALASSSGSVAASAKDVEAQLEALMAAGMSLTPEEVEERVAAVEAAGAALGINKVDPDLNDGSFAAAALAGRLKKVTAASAALTMAGLTFGTVQPAGLELSFRPLPPGLQPIYKGPLDGIPNGYSVTSAFAVPDHDLAGINVVSGNYRIDEENPQRLHVTFDKVTVTPELPTAGAERQAALERWVALFGGPNGTALDPTSGRIQVQVPNPTTVWLDFLAMTPTFQISRSSLGSTALLRRAA